MRCGDLVAVNAPTNLRKTAAENFHQKGALIVVEIRDNFSAKITSETQSQEKSEADEDASCVTR